MKKKRRIIPNSTTYLRHVWLEKLGGIQNVSVRNREWLTLLTEDTRNSLMIEGYFVSRAEISDLLENPRYTNIGYKVLGYFDSAVASYELAFQQYKTREFKITKSIIRQMHSLMFRGDPNFRWSPGEWRKGEMEITGSNVKTSLPFEIEKHIEALVEIINMQEDNLTRKLAVTHDMFEQIHPFPDGNGRIGRIILNFILIGHGYPNIAIKGTEKDKKIYTEALEEADPIIVKIINSSKKIDPFIKPLIQLEDLLNKSLAIALDVIICARYDKVKNLISLEEISKATGKSLTSMRVACAQKKLICSKIEGKIKSHQDLFAQPK